MVDHILNMKKMAHGSKTIQKSSLNSHVYCDTLLMFSKCTIFLALLEIRPLQYAHQYQSNLEINFVLFIYIYIYTFEKSVLLFRNIKMESSSLVDGKQFRKKILSKQVNSMFLFSFLNFFSFLLFYFFISTLTEAMT